jgi:hypothetical protein
MIPDWLHALSLAYLLTGLISAAIITVDLLRHPQHMWIMNAVWPVTALFGTVWVLWPYFTYGRLATHAKMHAAVERDEEPPNKRETPFPAMVGNGTLHCGAGCTLGDIAAEWLVFAVPVIAAWFGWQWIFSERIFAVWIVDYIFAYAFGIVFQYFYDRADAGPVVRQRSHRRHQGGHALSHGLADRHVWLHGNRLFRHLPGQSRRKARNQHRRVLVHDADRHALRFYNRLSGELVG